MTSIELLKEIESWLSFNTEPSKEETAKLRKSIKDHLTEQLSIHDDVSSKRFTDTDMLNAYIRGFKDADIDESGLGYVKKDLIIENGIKWLKEYHK